MSDQGQTTGGPNSKGQDTSFKSPIDHLSHHYSKFDGWRRRRNRYVRYIFNIVLALGLIWFVLWEFTPLSSTMNSAFQQCGWHWDCAFHQFENGSEANLTSVPNASLPAIAVSTPPSSAKPIPYIPETPVSKIPPTIVAVRQSSAPVDSSRETTEEVDSVQLETTQTDIPATPPKNLLTEQIKKPPLPIPVPTIPTYNVPINLPTHSSVLQSYTVTNNTVLRSTAEPFSDIVTNVSVGDTVTETTSDQSDPLWIRVHTDDGQTGYVERKYITGN